MAAKRAAKPSPAAPGPLEPCPDCNGSGYLIDGMDAVRCPCGTALGEETRRRLAAAEIPARYRDKSFGNFRAASPAHRAVRDTAMSWAESYHPVESQGLILKGGTGCGKTHLALAILRVVVEHGHTGLYVNFSDLLTRLRETYGDASAETEAEVLGKVNTPELVVLDDLGAENTTDWVRDRLYLIINRRYESQRSVVLTTNCTIAELDQRLGKRTVSRLFEMCPFQFPDFPEGDWRRANMK
ncbi:MAG: ATP-binding protein [Candidatus Sumerlaeia bacterium]|nr:ATP-binding protein [Candidatus Sumerlaeia bacterium]